MSSPFEMWSDRISAAQSVEARRELLAEAARWRAQHLGDVPAMRRVTFAISRLHALVGDHDRAVNEGRQLVSLLQTTPEASEDELEAARGHLSSLGLPLPRVATAGPPRRGRDRERPERGDRGDRGERPGRGARRELTEPRARTRPEPTDGGNNQALTEARRAAAREEYEAAVRLLDGVKGAGAAMVRIYVRLSQALASPDPIEALGPVRVELARVAGVALRGEASDASDPLSQLLGEAVPTKRIARIRAIEDFAEQHPERIDELAAAALRHHLATAGPTAPAPWLVGVVGQALTAGDAPHTTAAINELRQANAVAALAYDEWPFERLIRLRKRASALGYEVGGMRRGVLARGEPDDRKLWTLRLAKDGVERMVAVAPHATASYPSGKAEELGQRLRELCPLTLLVATGFGNAGLRSAAEAAGCAVREHDADDDALLESLSALAPREPAAAQATTSPPDQLASLLQEESPSLEALTEVVRAFRRPDRALRVVHRLALDDAHTAAVLRAVDAAAEPGRPLPEGTTLAILAAARGPETRSLLVEGGSVAERFAGPQVDQVIDIAKTLLDGGWDVHRVLRGPTRRETQAHPALDTFGPAMGGLWRLLVRSGSSRGDVERKGEVWFLADLPPEGRAGVPLLLLEDWQRVIVVPIGGGDLVAWWRTLAGAPEPLGWTGSEGPALLAAVEAFEVRANPEVRSDVASDEEGSAAS